MTPEQWHRVKELFEEALDREPGERSAFLAQACAGDDSLHGEVKSLLSSYEQESHFMETPAAALAAQSLVMEESVAFVGQQLGHYQLVREIGRGGMGLVYLATDVSLGRQVAIKLLPPYVTADPERLRRFEREARTTSALNHPNIVTIYEIGQQEHRQFIAMEFVEGQTLRQKLANGPLKLRDALDVAYQVAMALTAAHEAKIIHRDVKPENIMVRRDRIVKVLDFGLAKLTETTAQELDSEAATRALQTEPGRLMGTLTYMSPEQARGLDVDPRSDIWSLGVVLYEMVTGKAPFTGETTSHIAVAILENQPAPLSHFVPTAPSELQRIVRKSLAKDPDERYQSARDLLIDLKSLTQELEAASKMDRSTQAELSDEPAVARLTSEIATKSSTQTSGLQSAPSAPRPWPRIRKLLAPAGVLFGLLVTFVGWYFLRPHTITTTPLLIAIPLTTDPGFEGMPSLSPDGNYVVYTASDFEQQKDPDLYVKQIGGGPPFRITSGPAFDSFPAWSPDNLSIAFLRVKDDKVEVLLISPFGGPERKLAEITANAGSIFSWNPPALSWTPDSKYLVTMDRLSPEEPAGLFILSVATGEKRRLTTPPAPATADGNPAISPDGRTLAFVRVVADGITHVCVLPLSQDYGPAGEARHLDIPQPFLTSPAWTADGREIVYTASETWASGEWRLWRVPVSGTEKPQPLTTVGESGGQVTISHQGHRLVYSDFKYNTQISRIEVIGPRKRSPPVKLIESTRKDGAPQYSPDGSRIAFVSDRSGHAEIWVCNSDGSGLVQVTTLEFFSGSPQWFPDGRRLIFDVHRGGESGIYITDMESRVARQLTNNPSEDVTPSVSHDAKWIYFASKRTGRFEIWRMPAEGGEAVQLTHNGGFFPFESADGKVIYYAKAKANVETEVWKVSVSGGDETRVLGPVVQLEFAVMANGIYFIESGTHRDPASQGNAFKFFSFATGLTEKVADVRLIPDGRLSVSPDGRYALIETTDPWDGDLKLVENFR